MMLDQWNRVIFSNIQHRLQASAMKLVAAERNGEPFDSQLVIGVRESYGTFHSFLFFPVYPHLNSLFSGVKK